MPKGQTLTIQQAIERGLKHHNAGRLPEAESIYQQILQADPNQPNALHLLGMLAHQVGKNDIAVELITNALAHKPDYAEAHFNLAIAFKELGRLKEAAASYQKTLEINPGSAETHLNLGSVLKEMGQLGEAVTSYQKALSINPEYAEAHFNLGVLLGEQGRSHEAITRYQKALAIKPEFATAHYYLGNEHRNLGRFDESIASYFKALAIKSDYFEVWNNLKIPVKAHQFQQKRGDGGNGLQRIEIKDSTRATIDFAFLEYFLDSFKPHKLDEKFREVSSLLPSGIDDAIAISEDEFQSAKPLQLPNRLIALLHFGRSGSGLLHSLIDGHPEISALPSIYLRGFFNAGVWSRLSADGWRWLPERFADEFAVLFDSTSPKSTPGWLFENSSFLGRREGMTCVGENRNEALSVDRERFCAECHRLIKGLDKIDPKSFLMVVHAAYEKAIGTKSCKQTVFYHIHNPDDFTKLNFLRSVPDASLLMMIREPVQSCESWIRALFKENAHTQIVFRIISMLFAIDQIAFRRQDSVGVRLEDLKSRPKETMRALCTWLDISETTSLYQMTAQGKKWWGDPSSPAYEDNKAMAAFGTSPSQHPVGSVLSEQDQFILRTLFYPFSVRFSYQKSDPDQFLKDLKEIRPLLDDIWDFEKAIAERTNIDCAKLEKTGAHQFFRAGLIDRWLVLDEFGDYPYMLTPLSIS